MHTTCFIPHMFSTELEYLNFVSAAYFYGRTGFLLFPSKIGDKTGTLPENIKFWSYFRGVKNLLNFISKNAFTIIYFHSLWITPELSLQIVLFDLDFFEI